MKAPKTIWVDPGLAEDLEEKSEFIEEVQYIRADAMNELMAAFREWMDTYSDSEEEHRALVKIEDLMFALENQHGQDS